MTAVSSVAVDAACTACGACLPTCPERALRPAPLRPLVLDHRCTSCLACIEVCPVDAITPVELHPIEAESMRRLRAKVDLSHLPPLTRAVTERIIHASADLDYAASVKVSGEADLAAAVEALRAGAPVLCDVEMIRAGLADGIRSVCRLRDQADVPPDRRRTRTAAAMAAACADHPSGALVCVGNAPTALEEVLDLAAAGAFRPCLVVGLPVGFVGAAEAKAALAASGLPHVTNVGDKGGTAVATATLNTLWRQARTSEGR